jgi:serine/threonine protein kinase/Flp pilus assembly protein TadD
MKCPECQHENPDNTKFCGECGASLGVDLGSLSPTRTILGPVLRLKEGQMVAGKYKIIEKIGEGGMGIVYKAEDTKLRRNIALKFLPSGLTRDKKAKARFIQEAQAAAALNHPHICTIYEVDESDDQTFIAMEFIEGQTLKDKIEAGPLAIDEVVDIASQVAEGLGEANKKGIVHRDIKPANIMLTENGKAKIMDFGLAKLSWGADLTKPSMIIGTVAYMSPEQARGEPVDHRTDIWSLGAMLYEMLTGVKPFQKSHEHALIHAILNEKPDSLITARPDIPKALDAVIQKALEKDRSRRYQNMEALIKDIKSASFSGLGIGQMEESILVLPFANLSPDPDNEYFSDGLTEEIIADLSRLDSLRVISRTSAMQFKHTDKNVKDIARILNVEYVLEGSVRKAGNKLRITAQLIQADNDRHLWAEKYDGVLEDVFEIQETVSRKIVEALKGHISPKDLSQLAARPSFPNVSLYEAYSRAHYEFWKSAPESTNSALRILEKAIEVFGEHPLLVSGVGAIHWQYYHQRGDLNEVHLAKIDECAKKLFAGDPASAPGHRLKSYLSLHAGNSVEAIRHLQRAMEGDSSDAETLLWLSYLLAVHAGRPDQAKPVAERWVAIDPLHPIARMSLELVPWMKGELKSATKGVEEWYNQDPDDQIRAFYLGHLLAWTGRHEESLRLAEKMVRQDPGDGMGQTLLFLALAINGRAVAAKRAIPHSMRDSIWMDFHLPWLMAEGYALLGDKDEALRWLERAVEQGNFNYPLWNELDPLLANVRGEERFLKLMERVKKEWENFEV